MVLKGSSKDDSLILRMSISLALDGDRKDECAHHEREALDDGTHTHLAQRARGPGAKDGDSVRPSCVA